MKEQEKINGGDILIKSLLEENVKYLFGIPGGQFLNMYDAIYRWGEDKGIKTVMFRHEQAAAHAADAWARVTNLPGVCFGTVGPGATHMVSGVGTAWSDNIPIIAIVPQVNSKYNDSFTLQGNLDQLTMYKPITKYQTSIRAIEQIPDAVHKCFREALGGRPQPVLLEIYEDAFVDEIKDTDVQILSKEKYRAHHKPGADKATLERVLELIDNAEKPLIVAGGGVIRAEAWDILTMLAEFLKIPVVTTIMGIGAIPNTSKCLLGATIAGAGLTAAGQADLVLCLGCKFSYVMGHGDEPFWSDKQKMIQVDIDPTIIGRAKPIELGIIADCKVFLNQFYEHIKEKGPRETKEWMNKLAAQRERYITKLKKKGKKDKVPILPERLVHDVLNFMDEDAILAIDGGDIACYVQEQIDIHKNRPPLSTLQAVGMGHLGTAIPYGIGAKLAEPDKQVIAIAGDGSFMINIQDLETAVRLKLDNLIYVVGNNSAWGMIKSGQKLFMKKRYIDVDFPIFDFASCAEGFGCYGEKVTEPQNIIPALNRARDAQKPAVIDVKIKFDTPDATKLMGSMGIL